MQRQVRVVHPGFTLIEVLVVVAIIALLVAILLPALTQARAQSRSAVCASHLKEIGSAMVMFSMEHKGLVPRGASNYTKYTWVQWMARVFGDRMHYGELYNAVPVEKLEVLQCPERANTHPGAFLDYVNNGIDHRGPLDNNGFPSASGKWIGVLGFAKMELWKRPADTIYAADAAHEETENRVSYCLKNTRENIANIRAAGKVSNQGLQMFKPWAAYTLPAYPEDVERDGRDPRVALRMHMRRGSNVVYVDGHASILAPPARSSPDQVSQFYMQKWGVLRAVEMGIPGGYNGTHPNDSFGLGDENYVPF